jgi:hypothetical protein
VYVLDFETKKFTGFDFSMSARTVGIPYAHKDLRSFRGFTPSTITSLGKQWGLRTNFIGNAGMPAKDISIPLAIDEDGFATAWVKTFSEKPGAGFVQLSITPDRLDELGDVQRVAELGLR